MSDAARGPGTDEGCWVRTRSIVGCSDPRGGRPGAHIVLDEPSAKVVAFEFAPVTNSRNTPRTTR